MDQNKIFTHLKVFFPESDYSYKNFEQYVESGELNSNKDSFVNTLKGALLDESIVEVQLHDLQQVFFCRILDNPSSTDAAAATSAEDNSADGKYEKGSYLEDQESVIITPLEPSMGNHLIGLFKKSNNRVLLRIILANQATELGCYFQERTHVGDMPVLKLTFPVIAKKTKGVREFRVKIPKTMAFQVIVEREKKQPISTTPLNISTQGMALLNPMGRNSNLKVGEMIICALQIPQEKAVLVEASIIHVTRLRDSSGTQYCFGVRFSFTKPYIKASIEKIVALVQRKHLRELSHFEERFGVLYDK